MGYTLWVIIGYILGLYRDNAREMGNYYNGLHIGIYDRVYIRVI